MLKTFSDADTESLFRTGKARRLAQEIQRSGLRRLKDLDAARSLNDLRGAGRSLERLDNGMYAIRVNDKYRLIFRWDNGDAYDVAILDYH